MRGACCGGGGHGRRRAGRGEEGVAVDCEEGAVEAAAAAEWGGIERFIGGVLGIV